MSNPVTGITHSDAPPAVANPSQPKSAPAPAAPAKVAAPAALPSDTVTVSTAAKAALLEATETRSQTVSEASNGDRQAQRLLAKETAPK